MVEQDHRVVTRITDPILSLKFHCLAKKLMAGVETMHLLMKGQLHCPTGRPAVEADQFYSVAF